MGLQFDIGIESFQAYHCHICNQIQSKLGVADFVIAVFGHLLALSEGLVHFSVVSLV